MNFLIITRTLEKKIKTLINLKKYWEHKKNIKYLKVLC